MDLDDLYALPLDRFVAARDALAKAGDRSIKKLRKPSVAAWAVNQVARKPGLKGLLKAGDALVAAQDALLAGKGDGKKLRAARAGVDDAVAELRAAAAELRDEDGKPLAPTTLDRVADTLHAVALDESAREQVAEGRLERELQHAGLGLGGLEVFSATPTPKAKPAAKPATKKRAKAVEQDDAEARQAAEREEAERVAAEKAAAEKLARERKAAEAELARARKAADRAAKALIAAQTRRAKAAEALEAAEEELAEANTDADEAAEAVAEAESGLSVLDA